MDETVYSSRERIRLYSTNDEVLRHQSSQVSLPSVANCASVPAYPSPPEPWAHLQYLHHLSAQPWLCDKPPAPAVRPSLSLRIRSVTFGAPASGSRQNHCCAFHPFQRWRGPNAYKHARAEELATCRASRGVHSIPLEGHALAATRCFIPRRENHRS